MLQNFTENLAFNPVPTLIMPQINLQDYKVTISEKDLMPPPQLGDSVVHLQLNSPWARKFAYSHLKLTSNLEVALILKKLIEDCPCTQLNLSTAPISLANYQAFIQEYKPGELQVLQQEIAKQIMAPELSQSQRQAELRCVLALVYLQQDQIDRAKAQFKNAEKTPGFTLPPEFADLYAGLKHPRKAMK